jgi:8-oxo-dGTP pyrophosphatase MutT (NUDIX family)
MKEKNMPEDVATAVTFNAEKEKFLLLKRSEELDLNPDKWDFPSGRIDDEDARDAALRELEEETGIRGKILKTGESFLQETEDGNFKVHPFLVLAETEEVELSSEHTDYRWIDICELENFDTVPGLEKDLEKVGVSK